MADITRQKVSIIGSGIIGRSWAMLFAAADYRVVVYDKEPKQLTDAITEIKAQLDQLMRLDLMRGHLTVDQQLANISTTRSVQECVTGAMYIQECVPERLGMKQCVYNEIDELLNDSVVLASSASFLLPSALVHGIRHRNRFVVAHPSNPPFHMPLVELVPSPWTDDDVVPKAKVILETTGQVPVVLMKEIPGYVNNRLQNAMFSEIWRLIRDDIISVEDLEKVMSAGLGRQYAFIGPIEALYLECGGMYNVAQQYGDDIERVQRTMAENMPFKGPVLDKLQAGMENLGTQVARRQRRDRILAALSKLIKDADKKDRKCLTWFCYCINCG